MWKYSSSDFININLHETDFSGISLDEKDILLYFVGFNVCSTHSLNDTGEAKMTTASQIRLKNATFLESIVFDTQSQTSRKMGYDAFVSLIGLHEGIGVSDFTMRNVADAIVFTLSGRLHYEGLAEWFPQHISVSFSCDECVFYWNGYAYTVYDVR